MEDIQEFVGQAEDILGQRLEEVILYGSYARGDYVPGSDVDILFLVSEEDKDDWKKVSKMAANFSLERDVKFSPKVMEKKKFDERTDETAGFYSEVSDQGIKL